MCYYNIDYEVINMTHRNTQDEPGEIINDVPIGADPRSENFDITPPIEVITSADIPGPIPAVPERPQTRFSSDVNAANIHIQRALAAHAGGGVFRLRPGMIKPQDHYPLHSDRKE